MNSETERALWGIARGLALVALSLAQRAGQRIVAEAAEELESAASYRSDTNTEKPPAAEPS